MGTAASPTVTLSSLSPALPVALLAWRVKHWSLALGLGAATAAECALRGRIADSWLLGYRRCCRHAGGSLAPEEGCCETGGNVS